MNRLNHITPFPFLFFFPLCLISSFNVGEAGESQTLDNPFTPKAYITRYWKKQISNDLPKPWFLLNKASPMTAVESSTFTKLANQNALSTRLAAFCSSANLLCFPDLSPSLDNHDKDVGFTSFDDKNFTNYGSSRIGGVDTFKNYSDWKNIPVDSFRRYSRDSSGHDDEFSNYAPESNVVDQSFNTYAAAATGGTGAFKNYNAFVNIPNLKFTSYNDDANGRKQSFSTYTDKTNTGNEAFSSYGRNGNGAHHEFGNYGKESNVMVSGFTNYGQTGNGANDTFTSYGANGNVPNNKFKNYGDGGNSAVENFMTYRDQSNVGDDSFQSYTKNSNAAKVNFLNYGKSFNEGTDKFTGYGDGAVGQKIGFKTYGVNNTFNDYAKKGVTFARYINETSNELESMKANEKAMKRWVEPGKFFREEMLKRGNVMPMPDIVDRMPKRSFLPRMILSKLPFSTSKLAELKIMFHASDDSSMASILARALSECERAPSHGETKRCVGSVEDMIDFATSMLGRNVVARTTQNTNGSKENILIGEVKGINGGKVTESVSCHQSLFPYLLYYCHSVPKVRVYEADILNTKSEAKINHGVAICHLDTSSWSAGHGAFIALGSGPGQIEVCHWIFENDMTWTIAD